MPDVILVDKFNNQIGIEEKISAHQKGLLHRAFSIVVYNSKNQILIQKRANNKYHSGGLWANTCCSHPIPNYPIKKQIQERLIEEMGFECELDWTFDFIYQTVFDNGIIEYEYDHVFWGQYENEPIINKNEVSEYMWIDIPKLIGDIRNNSIKYAFWFTQIINKSLTNGLIEKNKISTRLQSQLNLP